MGFGLIGGVVAEEEVEDAGLGTGSFKGGMPRCAGACRQSGAGGEIFQAEEAGGETNGGQAPDSQVGFAGGGGAQAVVNHEGSYAPASTGGPIAGEDCEGHAVGAARDGDGKVRASLEWP